MRVGAVRDGRCAATSPCPGDKSIAHRALLLGALADGTTVVRGVLAAAPTSLRRSRRCARLGATVERRRRHACASRARGSSWARDGADGHRLRATPAPRCASALGLVAGARAPVTLDGDASLRRAADGARRRAAARAWARASRRPTAARRSAWTGGGLHGDRLDAAGGERAGEVGGAAGAALRARGTTRVARAAGEPRPHRAAAARTWACAVARRRRHRRASRAGSDCAAADVAAPRRSVVGGVPGRRRAARAGLASARARRRAQPDAHGRARRSCGAWARASASSATRDEAGRAARRPASCERRGSAARRSRPTRCRRPSTSCRCWPSPRRWPSGETRIAGAAELRVKESDRLAALAQLARPRRPRSTCDADGLVIAGPAAGRSRGGARRRARRPSHRDGVRGRRAVRARAASRSPTRLRRRVVPRLLRAARGARRARWRSRDARIVVAIDGPAGAGKSTASRALGAARSAIGYVDTGRDVPRRRRARATSAASRSTTTPRWRALVGDAALRAARRRHGARGRRARRVARRSARADAGELRLAGVDACRWCASGWSRCSARSGAAGGVVMEGRDIGTVVFPDAPVKFYLTAAPRERARRRAAELRARGEAVDEAALARELAARDARDRGRAHSPLRPARRRGRDRHHRARASTRWCDAHGGRVACRAR